MRAIHLLAATAALALASPAWADADGDFEALTQDYWAFTLKESPVLASSLGIKDYDDQLGDISLAGMDRRAAKSAEYLAALEAIPDDELSEDNRVAKAILARSLAETVDGNKFGQRMMLFTTYSGWHQGFAGLGEGLSFRNVADYENYLKRLSAYPAYNRTAIDISQQAVDGGYTLPCVVLGNVENSITGVIPTDATKSRLYGPFAARKPDTIDDAVWTDLGARAAAIIDGPVRQAYADHAAWYRDHYAPACKTEVGASALPDGKAYYAYAIKQMTTTDLGADQIHKLGLSEVARIRAEMEAVAKEAGFDSREAFIQELRTNPKYYAKSPEELMRHAARMAKRIDGLMPTLFTRLPRLPYGIREIPAEIAEGTTTAYYSPGSPESGISGTYYVNTSKLDQRPLWELPALTVHEAVPGHHHQIALQQEVDIPDWRKQLYFTAFTEGWGLYSERLGIEWASMKRPPPIWAVCPTKCGAPAGWSSTPASTARAGPSSRRSTSCSTIPR